MVQCGSLQGQAGAMGEESAVQSWGVRPLLVTVKTHIGRRQSSGTKNNDQDWSFEGWEGVGPRFCCNADSMHAKGVWWCLPIPIGLH